MKLVMQTTEPHSGIEHALDMQYALSQMPGYVFGYVTDDFRVHLIFEVNGDTLFAGQQRVYVHGGFNERD